MRRRLISVVGISLVMLGTTLFEITRAPVSGFSFIDAAHAAGRVAHRSAHRTARPARRHADVDVDVDRGGVGRVRDVDVDVDVDRHGRHRSVDVDVDVDRRPAVGAVAAGIAVGTRVATLPRGCTTVVTDDVTYHRCDGVYYRPYYESTKVVYVVVDAP